MTKTDKDLLLDIIEMLTKRINLIEEKVYIISERVTILISIIKGKDDIRP